MDTLGPVGVRQGAWNVSHDCVERLGRCVSSLRRLSEVLEQDSANVAFNLMRLALCLTLISALKTDGHTAVVQEGFCFTVSALCHDVYSALFGRYRHITRAAGSSTSVRTTGVDRDQPFSPR